MAERGTDTLLGGAGFTALRTEGVRVRFAVRDLDEYERWVVDVTGPFGTVVRDMPDRERDSLKAQLGGAFAPCVADRRYELRASLSARLRACAHLTEEGS